MHGNNIGDWADPQDIRAALAAGADPDRDPSGQTTPLHLAADVGSAESLAELLAVVKDVDRPDWADRTPLWYAVRSWDREKASALIAAGADPWRRSADGRSPGRIAWPTPLADLVAGLPGAVEPTPEERAAQEAADALIASFDPQSDDGHGGLCVAFVAGRDAADVLDAGIELLDGGVLRALSRGTVAVSVFDHPNAFIYPEVFRDGEVCPGDEVMRDPVEGAPEEAWLHRFGDGHPSGWMARALAMASALTGIRLDGGAAWFEEPCDLVFRIPGRPQR
ncbi:MULTISPECIES: ankyrin repeat domain-containing protein [unclassified Streptomyces]|uniref:ankyrin repeat domain-containing protein n=1 Tax=unclassified Streptomyces TaxID=2593676 RepID=UPI003369EAB7